MTDEGLAEAVNVAAGVRYFSTILHGAEVDLDEFDEETAEIAAYFRDQQAAQAGAD